LYPLSLTTLFRSLGRAAELTRPLGHAPRRLQPALAVAGQRRALNAAIEQRIAEALFELRQTPAHGRLPHAQTPRSFGQTAMICDSQEQPHVVPANIHFRMVSSKFRQFSYE